MIKMLKRELELRLSVALEIVAGLSLPRSFPQSWWKFRQTDNRQNSNPTTSQSFFVAWHLLKPALATWSN